METSKLTGYRIKEYLEQGNRFDGRKPDEFREITIETGVSARAEGSAKVKIGKTEVIVGVKMDVGAPYPDSADKGNLIITAELLPLSSSRYENGPPKFPAIELGRLVDRAIRESKFVELDKLCIKEGEKVWTVFVDIYSLNDDGNLLDAACLGAIAALKTARIPKYNEETGRTMYGELSDKKVPTTKDLPIMITAHKVGNGILVDPNQEEEDVSDCKITIGANVDGVISSMQKGNSAELSVEEFHEVLSITEKAREKVFKRVEKLLK